jgi:hypothetical protein
MKKKIFLLSIVLSFLVLNGCKKEKEDPDITGFFNNTEWAGEIKYNDQPFAEPYHIQFSPNGNFVWSQPVGPFSGTYTIDKATKTIALQFNGGALIKAVVTADKKFTKFSYGGTYPYTILGGELINTSTQVLDNTVWSSKETTSSGSVVNSAFSFLPGSTMKHGALMFPGTYQRSGALIIYNYPVVPNVFLVLTKENKMIGSWFSPAFPGTKSRLELTKQ